MSTPDTIRLFFAVIALTVLVACFAMGENAYEGDDDLGYDDTVFGGGDG
jgi:hypothetical protein